MGGYAEDRQWADQFMPQLEVVVKSLLLRTATFYLDTKQATDLFVYRVKNGPRKGQPVGSIAARIRRPGNFWQKSFKSKSWWGLQFTLRSHRSSGAETELAKVMHGFGDWFVYGHIECQQFRHWMALDLEVFRQCADDSLVYREIIDNRDGTFFHAYDVKTFPAEIIIGASDTIKYALEHGVPSVERAVALEDQRELRPPPDLQDFIRQHGGLYSAVSNADWAKWDRIMEDWKADMRADRLVVDSKSKLRGAA